MQQEGVFGFLGPNGAGTTTLRVLIDLIRPTHGRVRLFDLDSRKRDPPCGPPGRQWARRDTDGAAVSPAASALAQDDVKRVGHQTSEVDLEVQQKLTSVMQKTAGYDIIDIETQPVRLEGILLTYYDERQS